MAAMQQTIERLRETFIQHEVLARRPEIIAIFLGGSQLYNPQGDNQRDWDGAIIVNTKHDIFTLVNDHRQDLMDLIGMETEECPTTEFQVPYPSSPLWSKFDAVRFAGLGKSSEKRGVKIMSWEYFSQGRTSLNIFSYKDRRTYINVRPSPSGLLPFGIINQASTLPDRSVILHDQLVFPTSETSDKHLGQAIFGVTADLLVSAACLVGREPYGLEVKRKILEHYALVAGQQASFATLARCCRFSSPYKQWLSEELGDLQPVGVPIGPELHDFPSSTDQPIMSFAHADRAQISVHEDFSECAKVLPVEVCWQFDEGLASQHHGDQSLFAARSEQYTSTIGETEIFCKQPLSALWAEDEIEGALLTSNFYPRVQIPRMSISGLLLYPLFQGKAESEIRLSYIKEGRSNWDTAESLLYLELVKAEDTLRGYKKSLAQSKEIDSGSDYKIQRLFHSRLVDDVRLREYYGPGIQLMGNTIPFDEFLGMQWKINGVHYPPLRKLLDATCEVVKPGGPQISSCPVLFGHGDAHGGNIMMSSEPSPHSSPEVLFVDFEVSGFHPVMLDLAKPLYMDVFFESFYMDLIPSGDRPKVEYQIAENTLVVDFTPDVDWLSQAILDIKMRYLIQPLCEEIRDKLNMSLEDNVPLLSSALFLCASLAKNFAKDEEGFLLSFAIGITLAGAKSWSDLYSRFEKLGFKAST
ncbi:hypothetical protein F4821DRAFT_270169 [Hypoxylon rubiginosum]|uniref:Uncharacterized protein n=1 Tax=Hypoxylon rubiginosum TaxID=110542 RepID=A0ACC0D1C3_9PEZI|nr:hypothetical protein F4821DRAFT_270169 [Hypoxylon rubiginosum]